MYKGLALTWAVGVALIASGCPDDATPPPEACGEIAPASLAATAPDRRLLGLASPYPGDGALAARQDTLRTSQRARRAAAWEAAARVLAPVSLAEPTDVSGATVPRFRTWYDAEDLTRVFQRSYEALGADGRAARAPLDDAALDEAFAWNPRALDSAPGWTPERWAAYVARIRDGLDVAAVGGLQRITMSPDATRHLARSYPQILRCVADGAPPARVATTSTSTRRLLRETLSLPRCSSVVRGPYSLPAGARLESEFVAEATGDARLRVRADVDGAPGEIRCEGTGTLGCALDEGGSLFVEVIASESALTGTLEVRALIPDQAPPACLDGVFPLGAATVAQEWRRAELGPLPTYDTSAAVLAARFAEGPGATWGEGDGTAEPTADEIYTLRLPTGASFRLAGLHIRTRELEHWLNITLWWTPTPDEGFGADRPTSVRALGGPWSHYAMCVAIDDVESDPDPSGGFEGDAPTLAAALAAVHDGQGSWCSNPYIDAAPGLVQTNCVGCHQHANTGVAPGEVVMDATRFPANGRRFVRNNFPADGFWGLDAGDDLSVMITDTVEYWDTATP